jgi:hypothetical protein
MISENVIIWVLFEALLMWEVESDLEEEDVDDNGDEGTEWWVPC